MTVTKKEILRCGELPNEWNVIRDACNEGGRANQVWK